MRVTVQQAWDALAEGNERFMAGELRHPQQNAARRSELTGAQAPNAASPSQRAPRWPMAIPSHHPATGAATDAPIAAAAAVHLAREILLTPVGQLLAAAFGAIAGARQARRGV